MFYAYQQGNKIKTVYSAKPPQGSLGVVPSDISRDDFEYLKVTPAIGDDGNAINVITVDQALKTAGDSEKERANQISAAYQTMHTAIYDKLYEIFRTRNPETATAEHETWKDMLANPADYSSLGLVVDYQLMQADGTTELYSAGSALDTSQKITDFATRKLEQVREYGPFRAQKKQEYYTAKQNIENS